MELTDQELAALYERYAHVLFHRCRRILRNDEDAHDAVQETFARVMRNAATFRQQSSPLTWMYSISTNYCLNQVRNRKGRRQKREDHKDEIGGPSVVQPTSEHTEDHARILELLDTVDEEVRAVVVHTYFDDCTRQETAKLVGLSVPTVRKRLNHFLDLARRQLGAAAVALTLATLLPLLRSLT